MANQGVGNTALGVATCRLVEQYQPENSRLFHDPLIEELVGTSIREQMQLESMRDLAIQQMDASTPGVHGLLLARTCFIDDVVRDGLSQGIEQVVILGAGLDTRPYRLAGMEHARVFEVDLPSVQEDKKQKLHQHFGRLPEQVTFLPIDFDEESLEAVFSGTSFDPASPAIFVWEAVMQYISEEAVRRTLAFVGTSAPGSMLVFTYVLQSFIQGRSDIPGAQKLMDTMAERGAPWLFGLEPSSIASYLAPFHLHLMEDVGNAECQIRYFKPMGREMVMTELERIAQAVVVRP